MASSRGQYRQSNKARGPRNGRFGELVILNGRDDLIRTEFNISKVKTLEESLTIASGEITVDLSTPAQRIVTVDTEGAAASDTLTKINGGTTGEKIFLQSTDNARTVVVQRGSDIRLQADFTLNDTDDELFLRCIRANVWKEVSRANNA